MASQLIAHVAAWYIPTGQPLVNDMDGLTIDGAYRLEAQRMHSELERRARGQPLCVEIDIRPVKNKRTLDQNRLMWALLNRLALALSGDTPGGVTAEQCYLDLLGEFGAEVETWRVPVKALPALRNTYRVVQKVELLDNGYCIRTVANATIALEFDTTPQKYILGVTDEQYDVLISDKFKSYVGSLLAATSNPETGENPVFGQLAQGSLSPHTEKMRMTATQFAAATGLTVTDVGVVNDANPTSSDAILAQSQTLVLLAQQLNTGNGDALRTIAQMAQAILRNVPPGALTEEERNVMPHFKNPAMPSVAVTADAAIKIATAREEFASTDTFLEMIGFDQADIRRIRAQEQRVRGQQVLMEMEDEDNDAGVGDVHPQAGAAE